ncbi:hypothetical protein LT85_2343 [Collimonas arenae]|uniref:Uncharacterized protein n=1 Tax=Collimonas arenae TaxID=279058 RepID=A0A0A1FAD3_9BURK|nr:hypothetical protein LT85_2343 [Collimonas arenae]
MQEVLVQLVTPKVVHARSDSDSGYTADLISTLAVICAKNAWRHGYQVKVDSTFIPTEWIPMEPLTHYDNHYRFFK